MEKTRLEAYRQAVAILPLRLQKAALSLPEAIQIQCEELRLRAGAQLRYSTIGQETEILDAMVTAQDLQDLFARATRYSVHSFEESLQYGFITVEGGHRLGLCGMAAMRHGKMSGLRTITSVNLRIAAQCIGAASPVIEEIWHGGQVRSTLIIAAPAYGKTTVLRDAIRQLSARGIRVAAADERCEISGAAEGVAQFDLGQATDILCGAPKAAATIQLIKTMSPQVLAMDEITAPEDVQAMQYAAHCGAAVLATAHALDLASLQRKPLYQPLLADHVFSLAIEIQVENHVRKYHTLPIEEEK